MGCFLKGLQWLQLDELDAEGLQQLAEGGAGGGSEEQVVEDKDQARELHSSSLTSADRRSLAKGIRAGRNAH